MVYQFLQVFRFECYLKSVRFLKNKTFLIMNWTESKSKSKFIGRSCGRVTSSKVVGEVLEHCRDIPNSESWVSISGSGSGARNGTEQNPWTWNSWTFLEPWKPGGLKSWNRATLEPCAVTVQPWKNILELWVPTPDPCKSGTVLWMLGFSWYGSLPWNLGTRALELRNSGVMELWNPETLASSTWLET